MNSSKERAVAIVGAAAILPDAPNVASFWKNLLAARYSISDVRLDRWDPELYFDPDPRTPDKTYSKIGGWSREYEWDPFAWKLPIPPKVANAMDEAQKWAIACTRGALEDLAKGGGSIDRDRTAVILGNAMAGERHYQTSFRLQMPEMERLLAATPSFCALDGEARARVMDELRAATKASFPEITEDTMPGELANCIAGRLANLFDFHGPNYVVDAACASAMAALAASVEGLIEHEFDAVVTGGIDRNMGVPTFIKFCKIGALSATGTRPYGDGADGFVMGEGAVIFILKRLLDAERAGERIYAVIRGVGGASDGKGKGITAPNPAGQRLAIERAWRMAGCDPATATCIEGHGTSTRVGDVVELESLQAVFGAAGAKRGSIALGSVKSNIGHLKGAAGGAGILKAALGLRERLIPPSLNAVKPNPSFDFGNSAFVVNHQAREWERPNGTARRAGISAFGFGGTNFHVVLEEHAPELWHGASGGSKRDRIALSSSPSASSNAPAIEASARPMLRGALVLGERDKQALADRLRAAQAEAKSGRLDPPAPPRAAALAAPERIAIDYGSAEELAAKLEKALKVIESDAPAAWRALAAQGIHRGHGPKAPAAFLYTGQGSQYVNMLTELRAKEPLIAKTFAEADQALERFLGRPLTKIVFVDPNDERAVEEAGHELTQTAITQPAVLSVDFGLTRVLASFGIEPDFVMGHSLGEYGALVAADAISFAHALEAVSARGAEMTRVSVADKGRMAAVLAPIDEVKRVLASVDGYVVLANLNSGSQAVIGGASDAVIEAGKRLEAAGHRCIPLNVSHAFHTAIVAPASGPLRATLARLDLRAPKRPIISNVTGDFYPTDGDVREKMLDLLAQQVASPVLFAQGLETLHRHGARVFVELGPKSALKGFVDDVLVPKGDVVSLFTNHPKLGDLPSIGQALCGLWAAGHGAGRSEAIAVSTSIATATIAPSAPIAPTAQRPPLAKESAAMSAEAHRYEQLGRLFSDFLDQSRRIFGGESDVASGQPVVVTGAALGLPGTDRVFDDENVGRILRGQQFIGPIPPALRQRMADKHVTRLVKRADGDPSFETIDNVSEVLKLAGRARRFDIVEEFGVDSDRAGALDIVTQLAMGAGLDALRDAGLPLVRTYRVTTKGTKLPDRWRLPEPMRDDTGVIFASAFPGFDAFAKDITAAERDAARRGERTRLLAMREAITSANPPCPQALAAVDHRLQTIEAELAVEPHAFDRRFLFRVLAMGHSQFAEEIGARGPNTQINSACASTTQAIAMAEDWIRLGRARRVIVVAADDVTSDGLLEWIGAGFLATGAAATDERVEDAALPFDRRRHGMLMGMGAAAIVVEAADAARERGIRPICEVLSAASANSAFHGTRLDVEHIKHVMEAVVATAERRWGIDRTAIARETVFISHETYTPARGGSAAAEVEALRHVFGAQADQIVVANTKGFTGHPMGVGIEDVVAVKALETGVVPPVPNYREVDPELGMLNLSRGGSYDVRYALRLAAGFGSQISISLLRWVPTPTGVRPGVEALGYETRLVDRARYAEWLARMTGSPDSALEVVTRRLRVRENRAAAHAEAPRPQATITAPAPAVFPAAATPKVPASTPAPVLAAAPQAPPGESVRERVLAIVATATGYPREMLDPSLDLEADLGIDTVKQAEIFATLREEYGFERDANLKLRDFPTLEHVVGFVLGKRPDLAAAMPAPVTAPAPALASVAAPPAPSSAAGAIADRILEIVAKATGYPREMLEPSLDLEADLGIDTVKQAEVFAAVREAFSIERDPNLKLRDFPTLAHVVRFAEERSGLAAAAPVLAAAAASAVAQVSQAVSAASAARDSVLDNVLAVVARTTGYPAEMLDPELDLEADLGIDTVKQAEIFATLREEYGFERDPNLKLRDFPTLTRVAAFVRERAGLGAAPVASAAEATRAVAPAPAAPVAASVASSLGDPILERVLAVVARTTGYPAEMLDPELDLEADLGIDTVKQAEIFATLREEYGFERDPNMKLRDFPTLARVAAFVRDRTPSVAAAAPATMHETASPAMNAASAALDSALPAGDMDAANARPRRVPVPAWRPALDVCKPTGVVLDDSARVLVVHDRGRVGQALSQRLQKRGVTVLSIDEDTETDALVQRLEAWMAEGPIHGVYWLRALDPHPPVAEMTAEEWAHATRTRVKQLYMTMRTLGESFAQPGAFLVAATRLGGLHGYGSTGAENPQGGAVSGFVKAFKREQAGVHCKVVDFEAGRRSAEPADALIDETLRDPGAVEVGIKAGVRWGVGLRDIPVDGSAGAMTLDEHSVFVVTGAAGSIVSAIVADLARNSRGTFHLLDLAPAPDPNDADLAAFAKDREGLKRTLFERLKAQGEKATPARIERELARLERAHAALAAIEAVHHAGGVAVYHRVDLTKPEEVHAAITAVRERHERVDVLIHAAGLEISHFLKDKEPREYELVFDVKSTGWHAMMRALGDTPLGAAVVFSSVAGRFGNGGQTDYSAANDLLCKCALALPNEKPGARGIAIDWTAWAGIGMATRGSIPRMMELAGIDMLPPEAGIPVVRRELTMGPSVPELVVGDRLGVLLEPIDESGGIDTTALAHAIHGPMVQGAVQLGVDGVLRVRTLLDPKRQPFLHDHAIDGVPVLPGVMGVEAFAEIASLLLPGWDVTAIEEVNFLAPFKFYRGEPREVILRAEVLPSNGELHVACALLGSREIVGRSKPQTTVHFTARVNLSRARREAPQVAVPQRPGDRPEVGAADVYRVYFHGPAYKVLERAWSAAPGEAEGVMAQDLPANHEPSDRPLLVAPRHIELCFQTAGLYEMGTTGRLALPQSIGKMHCYADPAEAQGTLFTRVRRQEGDAGFNAVVVDESGRVYLELENYRAIELPGQAGGDTLAPIELAMNGRSERSS